MRIIAHSHSKPTNRSQKHCEKICRIICREGQISVDLFAEGGQISVGLFAEGGQISKELFAEGGQISIELFAYLQRVAKRRLGRRALHCHWLRPHIYW